VAREDELWWMLWFEGKKNLDWEHDFIVSYMIVPPPTKSTVMTDLQNAIKSQINPL